MKFIVIEMQTNSDGALSHLVTDHSDQLVAESKFHEILHYAAVSALPKHTASILNDEGRLLDTKCYKHGEEVTAGS